MPVKFKYFRSMMQSWDSLFEEAAAFANSLGPQRLINISHSEGDNNDGVVTVWY